MREIILLMRYDINNNLKPKPLERAVFSITGWYLLEDILILAAGALEMSVADC